MKVTSPFFLNFKTFINNRHSLLDINTTLYLNTIAINFIKITFLLIIFIPFFFFFWLFYAIFKRSIHTCSEIAYTNCRQWLNIVIIKLQDVVKRHFVYNVTTKQRFVTCPFHKSTSRKTRSLSTGLSEIR